jgi:hypothetical protein
MESFPFYWTREIARKGYNGPDLAILVYADGSSIRVDLRDWRGAHAEFMAKPEAPCGTLLGRKTGDWSVTFVNPLTGRNGYAGLKAMNEVEAVKALLRLLEDEVSAEAAVRADPLAFFERELARVDWYCAFSDDYGVTLRGEAHYRQVLALMAKVPEAAAKALWAKYAPEGIPFPEDAAAIPDEQLATA